MAKRRYHRRSRSFGSITSLSLGKFIPSSPLNKSVNSTDVLIGAAVGVLGGKLVKMALDKTDLTYKLPLFLQDKMDSVAAISAGLLAYALQAKSKRTRGLGHLIGASVAGVAPLLQDVNIPGLNGTDRISMNGFLVDDPNRLQGFLVDDPNRLQGFGDVERARLAAYADEDIDPFAALETQAVNVSTSPV